MYGVTKAVTVCTTGEKEDGRWKIVDGRKTAEQQGHGPSDCPKMRNWKAESGKAGVSVLRCFGG